MTALVTENIELLAGAPDGFRQVRALVLELAVRGLLVRPEVGIGDARDLLAQIMQSRASLVAIGALKHNSLPSVVDQHAPFRLPKHWVWTRLGEVTNYGETAKADVIADDAWLLDLEDIEKDRSRVLRRVTFSERRSLSDKNAFRAGDVLYCKLRPYLNKVIVADQDGFCTTEILPVRCHGGWVPVYFEVVLKSPYFLRYVNEKSYGMKMPRLGTADGRNAAFPLPPLAEQHRIVAKVDELMALCDRLEARQQDAEAAHVQLVQVLLDSLTQARDADGFRASWQRLAGQFSDVLATDASLVAVRASILELAFQGRLAAREHLADWKLVKLGSVAKLINGDRGSNYPNRSEYVPEGIAFVNTGHINPDGSLDLESMNYLTRDKFESLRSGKIEPDDLVYCLRGATLGKTAFVRPFKEGAIASSLVILRFSAAVLPEFAYYFLISPQGRRWIRKFDNGSAQPNLAANSVKEYEMPLPSVGEQREVVSRVTELLALCDQLKARIAAARAKHAQLAEALVAQAVAA